MSLAVAAADPAAAAPTDAPPSEGGAPVSAGYRRYVVGLLLFLYTVNFVDRQVVVILAEPIKSELKLSDTQLGLLTGLAFGLVYCSLGLVMARFADRFNRARIIAGSLLAWSICTVICGLASSYPTLLAARMGVGIGESAFTPTSHSLIADYTPRPKRASALATFSMGSSFGSLLGLALGGLMVDAFGWRAAFLLAGGPGLLISLLVIMTLREPRLLPGAAALHLSSAEHRSDGLRRTLSYLSHKQTFWCVAGGASICSFVGYGQGVFAFSFLLRVHGPQVEALAARFGLEPLGFLGLVIGLIVGVGGAVSAWVGGVLADRLGGRDLRAYGTVPAIASLAAIPFSVSAWLANDIVAVLLLLVPGCLLGNLWFGPVYATAQGVVPSHLRTKSASILLFIINMMGLGFGALCVGAVSDLANFRLGLGEAEGVRVALIASSCFLSISSVLFLLARRHIREEIVF